MTSDIEGSDRLAQRIAVVSMGVSAALAVVKIAVGLSAGSTAVVSDGFESAGDFFASGIVLLGLMLATKPPDEDHPYGHGRFETLAGLGVGVILAAAGAGICLRSLDRLDEVHAPAAYAMWPLVASVLAKGALSAVKFRVGRRTGSEALVADGWNDMVDILSGATALVAVALAVADPARFSAADHYGGFAVGLIVIFLGLRVVRDTALQLMDTMPDATRMSEIRAAAMRVPGALGIEKCFARKTGLHYHVDLHLEVDPDLTVRDSHEIARAVKKSIKNDLSWVADVLVHVEPHVAAASPAGPAHK